MRNDTQKDPKKTNPMVKWIVVHVVVIGVLMAGLFALTKMPKNDTANNDTVVYLVRHAEKITGENAGRDPALTAQGEARALVLNELLRSKGITRVHSSDYTRTKDTGAPLAQTLGLTIEIYDPSDLPAIAAKIKAAKGQHLVVGHSNTIPETVAALGGDGGTPIYEKSEYDRLYVVTIKQDGTVATKLRRYGVRYEAGANEEAAGKMPPAETPKKKLKSRDSPPSKETPTPASKGLKGENRPAKPIKRMPAPMPELAMQSGYCFMRFDVDENGRTFNVEAYKCTDDLFANPATETVRKWEYEPELKNGEAVVAKGVKTKMIFRLSDEKGVIIVQPKPIDKAVNEILPESQKAKLATEIPNQIRNFAYLPTPNYCCVDYNVSQTGKVFNEDVASCTDYSLLADSEKLIRILKFAPATYNGEKISSGPYSMLIKFFDFRKYSAKAPERMMPVIGSEADKMTFCAGK